MRLAARVVCDCAVRHAVRHAVGWAMGGGCFRLEGTNDRRVLLVPPQVLGIPDASTLGSSVPVGNAPAGEVALVQYMYATTLARVLAACALSARGMGGIERGERGERRTAAGAARRGGGDDEIGERGCAEREGWGEEERETERNGSRE